MAREHDEVNRPKHYTSGRIECIEAIESALTPEELKGFLKGNIIKYTWRERNKGGVESLAKAQWYLNRLLGTDLAPPADPPLPKLHVRREGDVVQGRIPKTIGEALGIKEELDAYDKVEAHVFRKEHM
jgi:hypothetical protein